MKIIRKLISIIFLLALAVTFVAIGYYFSVTNNIILTPEKLLLNNKSITMYDVENNVIKNVAAFSPKQTVPLEEIPKHTQAAFLNTEDKRFF